MLKKIQSIKVKIKVVKLKIKLNCFINFILFLGKKIIIKININKDIIINNNKFIELVKKLNIFGPTLYF